MTATEDLHTVVGAGERFHRFREVSGVAIIEAATAQLNARLAARGALRRPLGRCLRACELEALRSVPPAALSSARPRAAI